jgi:hypothetical protein
MPAWWREHALTTRRPSDGTIIDVHRSLPGVQVSDDELWNTLRGSTETLTVGDAAATVLRKPARALHAALHAAQHGGSPRDLEVLSRAIERLDDDGWRTAVDLAVSLRATPSLFRGLSYLPAGSMLAERLGIASDLEPGVEMRAAAVPEALTLAALLSTRGLLARLSLVRHKLIPPATFMRKWSPWAERGGIGLAIAYLWRPLWILGRLPRALRAWARARRAVQDSRAR